MQYLHEFNPPVVHGDIRGVRIFTFRLLELLHTRQRFDF